MWYAKCHLYIYNGDRTRSRDLGKFPFCLPLVNPNSHPSFGNLTQYEQVTQLYSEWCAAFPDIIFAGTPRANNPQYVIRTFPGLFPLNTLYAALSGSEYFIVCENLENGRVISQHDGLSQNVAYNTLSDFETDTNRLDQPQLPYFDMSWGAGSGERHGRANSLAVSSRTEQGICNFVNIYFEGITSSNGKLFISSITNHNQSNQNFYNWFFSVVKEYGVPYTDFDETTEDHGDPDPDQEDDVLDEDSLPTISFADAGFCRIFRPSQSQLLDLANYMWTDNTFLQTVINHAKQLLENPIESIIALNLIPCVPSVGTNQEVKVMWIPTGVYMPPVTNQFVTIDCGTYNLREMYGTALDYNPYTKVQLYMPFIGTADLDTDEVMGHVLNLKYNIDVVTGICCAYLKVDGSVRYQYSGHCAISQPITSADFSGYLNAAIAAAKVAVGVAGVAAGSPALASTLLDTPRPSVHTSETSRVVTERNPKTGRQVQSWTDSTITKSSNPGASFGEVANRAVVNSVNAVMGSKFHVDRAGGFGGNSGYIAGARYPYLIITHPNIANPKNYGKYNGYPSMLYLPLSDCPGFTQVQSIQLTGIPATNPELSEISSLLMSGVII